MTIRSAPSVNALFSGSGFLALLLAAWSAPILAATGVDVECPESDRQASLLAIDVQIPALEMPPLKVDSVDHGIDSSADIEDPIMDASLTSPAVNLSDDSAENDGDLDESDAALPETPSRATRLPGVSESDQPRFRRQMYRTDI